MCAKSIIALSLVQHMINLYQHALVCAVFVFNCAPVCAVIYTNRGNSNCWGISHNIYHNSDKNNNRGNSNCWVISHIVG